MRSVGSRWGYRQLIIQKEYKLTALFRSILMLQKCYSILVFTLTKGLFYLQFLQIDYEKPKLQVEFLSFVCSGPILAVNLKEIIRKVT